MTKQYLLSSLFVMGALFSAQSMGNNKEPSVGQVSAVQGECFMALNGKAPVKLALHDAVIENAILSTKSGSSVAVELTDHSQVKLGSNSEMRFDYLAKDSEKVNLDLKFGVAKSLVVKRLDQNRWFKIHGRGATMGVRGTEFVASIIPLPNNQFREEVQVIHGSVQVSDLAGKELAMVKDGMGLGLKSMMEGAQMKVMPQAFQPMPLSPKQMDAIKVEKFLVAPKVLDSMPSVKDMSKDVSKAVQDVKPGDLKQPNVKHPLNGNSLPPGSMAAPGSGLAPGAGAPQGMAPAMVGSMDPSKLPPPSGGAALAPPPSTTLAAPPPVNQPATGSVPNTALPPKPPTTLAAPPPGTLPPPPPPPTGTTGGTTTNPNGTTSPP